MDGFQLVVLTLMGSLVIIGFVRPHKLKSKDPEILSSAQIALMLSRKERKSKNQKDQENAKVA